MSKKKLVLAGLVAVLGLGAGVWGASHLLKPTWEGRRQELVEEISEKMALSGAPSKKVADKAAECIVDALIPLAEELGCSVEGKNAVKVISKCIDANPKMQVVFLTTLPTCVQESLQ